MQARGSVRELRDGLDNFDFHWLMLELLTDADPDYDTEACDWLSIERLTRDR